jgi:microcystin-dependent protein
MPDTYTPQLSLTKPEVGSSRDTWGTKTNANWDTLDQFVSMAMPIGAVLDFAGPNAPSGWLICDGRTVSRVTYAALFAVLGTAWGAGDGSTTFQLPAVNGRALVGPGAFTDSAGGSYSYSFTQSLGRLAVTIAQSNLPNYNLVTDVQGNHAHGGVTQAGGNHTHSTDTQGNHSHGGTTWGAGDHTHSGSTDTQGNHYHNVYSWGVGSASAGGYAVAYQGAGLGLNGYYTDTQGNHYHNLSINGVGQHTHPIPYDGSHGHNITYSGNLQFGINADGLHQHNITLGGGGIALSIQTPILVVTKIIYAGSEAAVRVVSDSATAGITIEHEPLDQQAEIAELREQIAELKALFAPAGRRRLLQAPLRGPH